MENTTRTRPARTINFDHAAKILSDKLRKQNRPEGFGPHNIDEQVSWITMVLQDTLKVLTRRENKVPKEILNAISPHKRRKKGRTSNIIAEEEHNIMDASTDECRNDPHDLMMLQDEARAELNSIVPANEPHKARAYKNKRNRQSRRTKTKNDTQPDNQTRKNCAPWWNKKLDTATRIVNRVKRLLVAEIKKCKADPDRPRSHLDTLAQRRRHIEPIYKQMIRITKEAAWRKVVSNGTQSIITKDGTVTSTEEQILDAMMASFFPPDNEDEDNYKQQKARKRATASYDVNTKDEEITIKEVNRCIDRQGNNKAPGHDQIPAELLKTTKETLGPILCDIFNQCLTQGYFPKDWKVATVIPIPKPNKPANTTGGWRPICLLSTLAKILDKIMIERIQRHMLVNKYITGRQYGFTSGKSTVHAIHDVNNFITHKRKDFHVAALFLDITGAFDNCRHTEIINAYSN